MSQRISNRKPIVNCDILLALLATVLGLTALGVAALAVFVFWQV